jgi:hypothetical protein
MGYVGANRQSPRNLHLHEPNFVKGGSGSRGRVSDPPNVPPLSAASRSVRDPPGVRSRAQARRSAVTRRRRKRSRKPRVQRGEVSLDISIS